MARQENGLQQLVRGSGKLGWCTSQWRLARLLERIGCCCHGQQQAAPVSDVLVPPLAGIPLHTLLPAQVLMALGDNPVVVEETCRTLALLARHSPALADAVVANDADALLRLRPAADERRALATLGLLAALAHSSSDASTRLATDSLLACLTRMVGGEGGGGGSAAPSAAPGEAVRTAALKALGNLAFCDENRRRLERRPALMQQLSELALSSEEPTRVQVRQLEWVGLGAC